MKIILDLRKTIIYNSVVIFAALTITLTIIQLS